MSDAASPSDPQHARPAWFHTTRWSLVLAAQGKANGDAVQSLEALCCQYWQPLFAYVRHRGYTEHDAQDLTQAFFARFLEKGWLAAAQRDRGKFRTFLLMALKRFLANEWDHSQAKKRGGAVKFISIDAAEPISIPDPSEPSADSIFEKRWAIAVIEAVVQRLRAEYEGAGRLAQYELLKPQLTAERGGVDYDALSRALDVEPASARSSVHRLRKRFREIFRDEVAGTVADPADIEHEMHILLAALGAG